MSMNIGALGDSLYEKNQEIAAVNAQLKELENQKREIENQLLGQMLEIGTDIVRGQLATISISESVKPTLQDPEEFYKFVLRHKALHLFERRIASKAFQEMRTQIGKPIPGVSEFTVTRLNVRKV